MTLSVSTRGFEDGTRPPEPQTVFDEWSEIARNALIAAGRSLWERLALPGILVAVVSGAIALEAAGGAGLGNFAGMAAAIAAATCIGVAWQASGRLRVGWGAIGIGGVFWCAGYHARPIWETARAGVAVSMTVRDLAALGGMILFGIGILALLEKPQRAAARLRLLAEALMIAASILFASWVTVLPPAFEAVKGRPLLDQARLLAYPISDVLLIGIVVFAITKLPQLGRWSLLLLGGIGAIAMLSTAVSELDPTQVARMRLVDAATASGFLAVVLAAGKAWRLAAEDGIARVRERTQLMLLSAPGLSVLIVVGTTLRQVTGKPVAAQLTWITIGVLSLSVLLHITVIFENHTLSGELALARDEAIHASVLKSHFLANVSHEIRTPMNAVIGLTGLLLDTELEFDQRELAVGVATSAEGLLGLIDGVLDFSKIEAQKMELEEIDLDLVDLIDEVAMIVGDAARRKGIEVVAYCEPGLVTQRRGDPVRLRQILLNLANNAVKFTSEGSVTIQAMPGDGGPEQVAFLVIDTGIGIPETEQSRLFEPFSQLDESTTRNFGGTGLGLGIVRGLVDLNKGSIDMASEEGVGTVFRITLPLPVGTQQETEKGLAGLVGKRALIVDDNAVNRSVLAHTLHSWGFVVDQATTAEEALHHYAWTGSPDQVYAIVIIEHRLEGMDGMQLARILRTQGPTASAVTFLLSSAVDLSRQAAHDAGIESVLIKPVRNTYLLRRIVDALITQPAIEPTAAGQSRKDATNAPNPPR
ncbi:MAG: hybrid sensor histidine kinase/response regulator [Acidimicrobiales bacterium]|nr:hybrid sensor histidine kinase/response regulator [Acidimicrobiales bacterium]